MGTLTANDPLLPAYCTHKLPTSCRLSSIPNCCACADERAHAATYSTYIDGIGFVPRGNRWQRYCWYCKEFWQRRVEVSGLRPAQTRIPEEPDQREFLERWYEFYRGYRLVKFEDGREERVAVVGEDFRDVSPGCLPRTVAEMREGRMAEVGQVQPPRSVEEVRQESGPSLEEALESLYESVVSEEQTQQQAETSTAHVHEVQSLPEPELERSHIHAQAMNPPPARNREYQVRRVAALRRQLLRLRTGIERVISGLRDLGENVPDDNESGVVIDRLNAIIDTPARELTDQATSTSPGANRAAANMQEVEDRIDTTRRLVNTARERRDRTATDLETAQSELQDLTRHLQHLQREQRTMENYMRVFGTREEVIAQGENYESPIGGMFNRAMERFRVAEDVRREERTLRQVLEDEARIDSTEAVSRRLEELESRERDVWGVPRVDGHREPELIRRMREVRDAESGSQVPAVTVAARDSAAAYIGFGHEVDSDNEDEEENETPPVLANTDDESALQEYYAMIRRQDWSHEPSTQENSELLDDDNNNNFPRNMLNAIVAARAREVADRSENSQNVQDDADGDEQNINESVPHFSEDEWWHEDAKIIITALTEDASLRDELGMTAQDAAILLAYFIDDYISERDRTTIDGLLRNDTSIWRTGLPSEWLKRRMELVRAGLILPPGFFTGDGGNGGSVPWATHHNPYMQIEVTAQAFMMSRAVRQTCPALSAPAQLQMLYRLQAGRRITQDIEKLEQMRNDEATFSFVLDVYRRSLSEDDRDAEATERVNTTRREVARQGNHSRQELNTRRLSMQDMSTRAWALAAGRQAMQTGSQALLEQAANAAAAAANTAAAEAEDPETAGTRAAYHRLRTNNFIPHNWPSAGTTRTTLYRRLTPSSPSSRSSSPSPNRGLDARDSGRPEPKSEADLTVSMECKICYTQMAEIACLPCGHLVMCRWCSEQHSPCFAQDRTRPRRATGCPVCRKGVRQKVRVFRV